MSNRSLKGIIPLEILSTGDLQMNMTKYGTAAAMSLALAGGGGLANAEITGVPGEAVLGPMVLTTGGAETYIGLYVPTTIGMDTVTALSAPHVLAGGPVTQTNFIPEIHWTLFDHRSKKVENGTCEVSPGDYVLWTTDPNVQAVQTEQRRELLQAGILGIPDPVCGPSSDTNGYVVFQTIPGADGADADFAFWANGAVVLPGGFLGLPNASIGTVPMLAMADGADPLPVGSGEPTIGNSVISGGRYLDGIPADPVKYAPILAGIRMNNGDAFDDVVRIQAPIQGPAGGNGISIHAFWFDRNDPDRFPSTLVWDDQEGNCSDSVPLPYELNVWAYNYPSGTRRMTELLTGTSWDYCLPDYWNPNGFYPGALGGYVEYELQEINDPYPAPGLVNSAMAAWNWQQSVVPNTGWATHMTTDLGKF
jgi:hypothetical protein